jgi:hypothetical protein
MRSDKNGLWNVVGLPEPLYAAYPPRRATNLPAPTIIHHHAACIMNFTLPCIVNDADGVAAARLAQAALCSVHKRSNAAYDSERLSSPSRHEDLQRR